MLFWKKLENKYIKTLDDVYQDVLNNVSDKNEFLLKFNSVIFKNKENFKLENVLSENFNEFKTIVEYSYDYSNEKYFKLFFELCEDDLNNQIYNNVLSYNEISSNHTLDFVNKHKIIPTFDIIKEQIDFCIINLEDTNDLKWLNQLGKVFY